MLRVKQACFRRRHPAHCQSASIHETTVPEMIELQNTESLSLVPLVGEDMYAAWMDMLKALIPGDRGRRMKSVVAAMLQYAYLRRDKAPNHESGILLKQAREWMGDGDPLEFLFPVVERLCSDAGFASVRANNTGQAGGLIYDAIREFVIWPNRPWE